MVAIDEAHRNTHTFGSPQFRGLVELLGDEGYRVRALATAITSTVLSDLGVLVVSNPGGWLDEERSLTDGEIATLVSWVRAGGSMLVIVDHRPAPRNAARLAAALGVTSWENGSVMVDVPGSAPVGNIIFWREEFLPKGAPAVGIAGPGGATAYQGLDAVLKTHRITEGRGPDERVRRVVTFVGSGFRPPVAAETLMILPAQAVSLTPAEPGGDVLKNANRTPVASWAQGAAMEFGKGRVALFGETGLFSGGAAPDNRQFVVNVMRWLTRVL